MLKFKLTFERLLVVTVLATAFFVGALYRPTASYTAQPSSPPGQCGGTEKVEDPGDDYTIVDSLQRTISNVWIKASTDCFAFTPPGGTYPPGSEDPCYQVTWINNYTVRVQRLREGPDCQDISHIEWSFDVTTPTPTPTPTDPTPTPSGSPTPAPTPTETPAPTPTPTDNGGTGGTNDGGGSSSSNTTQQVLAASTMAKTGGFEENLMTAALALGFTLSGVSIRGYFASKKN